MKCKSPPLLLPHNLIQPTYCVILNLSSPPLRSQIYFICVCSAWDIDFMATHLSFDSSFLSIAIQSTNQFNCSLSQWTDLLCTCMRSRSNPLFKISNPFRCSTRPTISFNSLRKTAKWHWSIRQKKIPKVKIKNMNLRNLWTTFGNKHRSTYCFFLRSFSILLPFLLWISIRKSILWKYAFNQWHE